jgi:hypothetical protein
LRDMAHHTDPDVKTRADDARVPDAAEPARPRFEERIEGDPFEVLGKYEEVTLPPHARLKWLSAELPSAPPELLQDTLPPNGGAKAPEMLTEAAPDATDDWFSPPVTRNSEDASNAANLPEPLEQQDTVLVPRVRRRRRLRDVVVLAIGAAATLTAVALLLSWPRPQAIDVPATVPRSTPSIAPAAEPKPAVTQPATAATPSANLPANSAAQPAADPSREQRPAPQSPPRKKPSVPVKPPPPTGDSDISKPWED